MLQRWFSCGQLHGFNAEVHFRDASPLQGSRAKPRSVETLFHASTVHVLTWPQAYESVA